MTLGKSSSLSLSFLFFILQVEWTTCFVRSLSGLNGLFPPLQRDPVAGLQLKALHRANI